MVYMLQKAKYLVHSRTKLSENLFLSTPFFMCSLAVGTSIAKHQQSAPIHSDLPMVVTLLLASDLDYY